MTYLEMIEKIKKGERFSFARYGDGEFNAIYQDTKSKSNCDLHPYHPDMGERLMSILQSNPNYYLGLQSLAYRQRKQQIDALGIDWCEANILHRASQHGRLGELLSALENRNVLLVGPIHLKKLAVTHNWYYLNVASKNCWLGYEDTKEELKSLIGIKDWVVLYCCSMMANVIVDDFNGQATQIDCGSVFDVYCGVRSRQYMRNMKVDTI